ncbi:hypothetical protein BDB00DRAFT_859310 [Zychaea mexicana]|uniref:uncharacterized protein n=1 Tax=Zychaea mexicana TaxID=64656 RepID=UPI0022FDC41B|nr:uncharacterized protein BDB00DRAFT_859310 [Zychaea mexicana]KAI9477168.1 hypothetical protein BDB00DRAFT_859310 [Zychaea mexicana]
MDDAQLPEVSPGTGNGNHGDRSFSYFCYLTAHIIPTPSSTRQLLCLHCSFIVCNLFHKPD